MVGRILLSRLLNGRVRFPRPGRISGDVRSMLLLGVDRDWRAIALVNEKQKRPQKRSGRSMLMTTQVECSPSPRENFATLIYIAIFTWEFQ